MIFRSSNPVRFALLLAAHAAMAATGCVNTISSAPKASKGLLQRQTSTAAAGAPQIVDLTRAEINVGADELVIYGDGGGDLGRYCAFNTGASAAPPCFVEFRMFLPPNGTETTVRLPISGFSDNWVSVRLSSGLPSGVPEGAATVLVYASDGSLQGVSNVLAVTLSTVNAAAVSNLSNFTRIRRYQCRPNVVVPSAYEPSGRVYDPFQSENRDLARAYTFYTPNLGEDLVRFITSGVDSTEWNCPPVPSDGYEALAHQDAGMQQRARPNAAPLTVMNRAQRADQARRAAQAEMRIFRAGALETLRAGNVEYALPEGRFDDDGLQFTDGANPAKPNEATSFWLSRRFIAGTYEMPMFAFRKPQTATSEFIGFGAAPTNTAEEACPGPSAAPTGFKWVKVWLFRVDTPTLSALQPAPGYLSQLFGGFLFCHPGGGELQLMNGSGSANAIPGTCSGAGLTGHSGTGDVRRLQGTPVASGSGGSSIKFTGTLGSCDAMLHSPHRNSTLPGTAPDSNSVPALTAATPFPANGTVNLPKKSREEILLVTPASVKRADVQGTNDWTPARILPNSGKAFPSPQVRSFQSVTQDRDVDVGGGTVRIQYPICALQPDSAAGMEELE